MKKWFWFLCLMIVFVGIGLGFRYWQNTKHIELAYRVVKVEKGTLNLTILSTGIVEPQNRLEIKPPIAGRVEKVLVDEGDEVKQGQLLAWMSSTERAALLDAARAKNELKQWEELYRPTAILAPIDGTVIQRNVEPGQSFTNLDSILVMSDRLTVKAQVDETDIAQIRMNQSAEIVLDAYPEQPLRGHVVQIAFDAKTVNNVTTYIVDVLVEKTPKYMRSGMTANVRFSVASKSDVAIVSADAIQVENGKSFVLVGDPKEPQRKIVETGISDKKQIEIISGLVAGDEILVPELRIDDRKDKGGSPFSPFGRRR